MAADTQVVRQLVGLLAAQLTEGQEYGINGRSGVHGALPLLADLLVAADAVGILCIVFQRDGLPVRRCLCRREERVVLLNLVCTVGSPDGGIWRSQTGCQHGHSQDYNGPPQRQPAGSQDTAAKTS